MVSADDIRALRRFRTDSDRILSLYLELDPQKGHAGTCRTLLSDALLEDPRFRAASRDCERAGQFVSELEPGAHKGLALFSASADGLWLALPLPQPVPAAARLSREPYLAPLDNILDQYQRYAVLLADGRQARLLEVFLGQIEEHPPLKAEGAGPAPGSEAWRSHLGAVAREVLRLSRERGLDRILLGAPPELEPALIGHLHTRIQDGLIADPTLDPAASREEVLERVLTGERESRKVRESVLVYRLLDAARSEGMGVVGLAPVLAALREKRVRLLLVRQGLARMGRLCKACGGLTLTGKKCPYCWADTEPTVNLVADMVRKALEAGCEVTQILSDPRLDACGGVGAELTAPGPSSSAPAEKPERPMLEGVPAPPTAPPAAPPTAPVEKP